MLSQKCSEDLSLEGQNAVILDVPVDRGACIFNLLASEFYI